MRTVARKQFDEALANLNEAAQAIDSQDFPEPAQRILAVASQCKVVKAAAMALATDVEFRRLRAQEKKP